MVDSILFCCRRVVSVVDCSMKLRMVRNIDLPEAVILYGTMLFLDPSKTKLRNGLFHLLNECYETKTFVIVLLDCLFHENNKHNNNNKTIQNLYWNDSTTTTTISSSSSSSELLNHVLFKLHKKKNMSSILQFYNQTVKAPDPTDLIQSITSLQIQPRNFGGSSGFGRSQRNQPIRTVEANRVVVIGTTEEHSRAARYAGMRVLSTYHKDRLADAVLTNADADNDNDENFFLYDFGLDDIATPGSFWLNPPHPRDDEGNRVDSFEIMEYFFSKKEDKLQQQQQQQQKQRCYNHLPNAMERGNSDDEIVDYDAILADLDPLV